MKTLLKMIYHDPRPFWVEDDIQALACSSSYGNPSGHAIMPIGTGLAIWLDYNASIDTERDSFWSKWYTRLFFLLLALLYGVSIG